MNNNQQYPNKELRLRALSMHSRGESWEEMAVRADYLRDGGDPYPHALKVALGIQAVDGGHLQTHVTEATALRIGRALLLDPVDLNL